MKVITTLLMLCTFSTYAKQSEVQMYSNNNGIISDIGFIDEQDPSVGSLSYSLQNPISTTVSTSNYTIKTARFVGWENEPGDFDVIEISRNGQQQLIYKAYDGIAKLNDSQNLYTSQFSQFSTNGYFIEIPLTATSKALIFLGYHYGTDFPRLFIFIATDLDVKLVYNQKMYLKHIDTSNGNFILSIVSGIVENDDETTTETTKRIYLSGGVLVYR
jgi:hypothetical protein